MTQKKNIWLSTAGTVTEAFYAEVDIAKVSKIIVKIG
jgi:hypothetical protein